MIRTSPRVEGGRPTPGVRVDGKLGEVGYNEVSWLSGWDDSTRSKSFVLRLQVPKPDALLPFEVLDEVACISMISAHCPNIPVPKIYALDVEAPDPFVPQEYMEDEPLSTIWNHRYAQTEKGLVVALKLAEISVDMAEARFSSIGGFTSRASYTLGPTVERSKLLKGQGKFHSNRCYPIGPYKIARHMFSLTTYDEEIYYYSFTFELQLPKIHLFLYPPRDPWSSQSHKSPNLKVLRHGGYLCGGGRCQPVFEILVVRVGRSEPRVERVRNESHDVVLQTSISSTNSSSSTSTTPSTTSSSTTSSSTSSTHVDELVLSLFFNITYNLDFDIKQQQAASGFQ